MANKGACNLRAPVIAWMKSYSLQDVREAVQDHLPPPFQPYDWQIEDCIATAKANDTISVIKTGGGKIILPWLSCSIVRAVGLKLQEPLENKQRDACKRPRVVIVALPFSLGTVLFVVLVERMARC